MDFNRVVSVTLGLPFLRFSVDHGTAYGIAGRGIADARNMETVLAEAARTWRPLEDRSVQDDDERTLRTAAAARACGAEWAILTGVESSRMRRAASR